MMTIYYVLDVLALFFALGPLHFVFLMLLFHLLHLKLFIVDVECGSSIPYADPSSTGGS